MGRSVKGIVRGRRRREGTKKVMQMERKKKNGATPWEANGIKTTEMPVKGRTSM